MMTIKNELYEAEQFAGQNIFGFEAQSTPDGSTYISINAITANIGDWIVKQTDSDGLSESEIYTIWTKDLFVKYFKV